MKKSDRDSFRRKKFAMLFRYICFGCFSFVSVCVCNVCVRANKDLFAKWI